MTHIHSNAVITAALLAMLLTGCATGRPAKTAELAADAASTVNGAISDIKTGDRRVGLGEGE